MKMLIIEDDRDICELIEYSFKEEGFSVDIALDGERGSFWGRTNVYDIIILDYSLPKKNGHTVCSEIRASGKSSPIIFLSVSYDVDKKVEALERGADDYMTKPFSFEELRARVRTILRRPKKVKNPIIKIGDISMDTNKQEVYKNAKSIYLTRKEYNLLEYLMRSPGAILSRSMIMEHVWDSDSDPFSNTVESHILKIRKKINTDSQKDLIRNIPGRGYTIGL